MYLIGIVSDDYPTEDRRDDCRCPGRPYCAVLGPGQIFCCLRCNQASTAQWQGSVVWVELGAGVATFVARCCVMRATSPPRYQSRSCSGVCSVRLWYWDSKGMPNYPNFGMRARGRGVVADVPAGDQRLPLDSPHYQEERLGSNILAVHPRQSSPPGNRRRARRVDSWYPREVIPRACCRYCATE